MSKMVTQGKHTQLEMPSQLYGLTYWYPCVHNLKTCREIQSLNSWHTHNLSRNHTIGGLNIRTSEIALRSVSLALPPLASKSPILLSGISMSNYIQKLVSYVLMLVKKITGFIMQPFVVIWTTIVPLFLAKVSHNDSQIYMKAACK